MGLEIQGFNTASFSSGIWGFGFGLAEALQRVTVALGPRLRKARTVRQEEPDPQFRKHPFPSPLAQGA